MNRTVSFIIFLTVVVGVYGLLNAYFLYRHRNVISLKSLPKMLFRLVAATIILTPVATIIFSANEVPLLAAVTGFVGYGWLAFLFLFLVTHGLADIVLFVVERLGRKVPKHAAQWVFGMSVGVNVLILTYGAFDAQNIRVEKLAIVTSKLPAGTEPITMVQLSDIHFSSMTGKNTALRIQALISDIEPDIVVCTGDLLDRGVKDADEVKKILTHVAAPMGKFAIPGNHEYYVGIKESEAFIKEAGFTYLRDSAITVNGLINIVGIDDITAKRFGQQTGISEKEILEPLDETLYTIVLKHQPLIEESSLPYYDLQLSGHTHAGQIFPFAVLVKLVFPYFSGRYDLDESTQIYVNRGTGTWGPPFRFLAPPELTVITLSPATTE